MNLVGYTATALSRNDIEDTPTNKNVVDFAIVELKDLQGNLVVMYDDAEGANPETQKVCDTNGQVDFFAEAGDYNLEINGKAQRINLAANIADYINLDTGESVQEFADSFALKIFQSPTDGGLTEIQTRTVDANEVYEVRKTSDDSLATIYSDAAGTTEIVQNGTDNKSGGDGVVELYIADGEYFVEVGALKANFKVKLTLEISSVTHGFSKIKPVENAIYRAISFYKDVTGGGGYFKYDSSVLKSEHNGIDIISPTVQFSDWSNWIEGNGEADQSGSGCFVRSVGDGVITASQCGLIGESLFDSTQLYKLVNYNVKRWTQNQDSQSVMEWFVSSDRFNTFKVDSKIIYVSGVVGGDWSNKTLTGVSRSCSGIINGNFFAGDGTKHMRVNKLGFYGKIGLFDVPLPITGDASLADDPNYFYVGDIATFGWGFGVGGAATASSTGNSDDIIWEDCYFEMRGGTISGGSAPNDEDRPKVTNVVFRNNLCVNNFYHGAAGIHFKDMLVHDNVWINQYYGYAVDFSLGCIDCKAYNNVSLGLCSGGAKTESRAFPGGNSGCEIYDNHFTITGGNGFNLVGRLSGENSRLERNTYDIYNYTAGGQDFPLITVVAPKSTVKDNVFNIYTVATEEPLRTVVSLSTEAISSYPSVSLDFSGNEINNHTTTPLRVVNISLGTKDFVRIRNNDLNGRFESVFSRAFSGASGNTSELDIIGNKGTTGSLFRLGYAESFGDINILDNKGDIGTDAIDNRLVGVSFANIAGSLNLCENKINSSAGDFTIISGTSGVTLSDVNINGNDFKGMTGALCYLYQNGSEVNYDKFTCTKNNLIWDSASSRAGIRAVGGAGSKFMMGFNTIVNEDPVNDVNIIRPVDGVDSVYNYNITNGEVGDIPI